MKNKVSVIIPCFNLGEFLKDAVSSVDGQTYQNKEIIIVDDGSTDAVTKRALNTLAKARAELKIIKQDNAGPAAARNAGIAKAKGDYIVCLDADDMLASDYIEKTVTALEAAPSKVSVATTWLREFGERSNVWETGAYDVPKMLITNTLHAGSLFTKAAWEKVGGFNERRDLQGYEDWDFWLKIIDAGYEWVRLNQPLFYYRIRKGSLLASAKDNHLEKYLLIFSLHKSLFSRYAGELAIENAAEIKELHRAIAEKNKAIEELSAYREEVINLRAEIFGLHDEINSMRNARVLGRIIKGREWIGATRQKLAKSPRTLAHQIRVIGAPFLPRPIRRAIKRRVKSLLRRPSRVVYYRNPKWGKGPLVSVVIPYYNRADTINETVESLLTQTLRDFETIMVDDGSTDHDSIIKVSQIKKDHPRIKVLKQVNKGVAAARNYGIKEAAGKYIVCLDSDDVLEPTFLEKCTILLEADSSISLATTYMQSFGVIDEVYQHIAYDPEDIIRNNMVITAAQYTKHAWREVGGYKTDIGYEDWEFWVALSERGYWGKLIPEALFKYRTAMDSRYTGDKQVHWTNLKIIRSLHPNFKRNVRRIKSKRQNLHTVVEPKTALINLNHTAQYTASPNSHPNVLIAIPWMTFGGAETLILNFCNEVKDEVNLSFVTGLASPHEWEHKFRNITQDIYHLSNLFLDDSYYVEFFSNYIATRNIQILHIIHTAYVFKFLPELKRRHPALKVVVTIFNARAEHFDRSLEVKDSVDVFTSDNAHVQSRYLAELGESARPVKVIPNGINSSHIFSPLVFDRSKERDALKIFDDELAVFYVGRLSEEKNPDVFVEAAQKLNDVPKLKFFIIGDGPMRDQIERKLAHSKLDNIEYLGYQSDIAKYLSAADIFVLPSSIEGFPLSILEAMAMKVVVVASDVGAVAEVISNGVEGFIVTPGSAKEIAEKIRLLNDDRTKLDLFKVRSRKKVENKYSDAILKRNYQKLYRELTG